MATRISHPFAVDIRAPRPGRFGYTWSIRQGRVVKGQSVTTYSTFEEARLALKAALVRLVTDRDTAR